MMKISHPEPFIILNERKRSTLVHSLFSAWMLAFLFEGQILFSLVGYYGSSSPNEMIFGGTAAFFLGLLLGGLFIKSKRAAKNLFLYSYFYFIAISMFFFFPPSALWTIGIITGSLLAGGCVAAWGYYLKSSTPKKERIKTIAEMLILSNLLMILLNVTAIYVSPLAGLALSMVMLVGAFLLAMKLPALDAASPTFSEQNESVKSLARLLIFLCLFITIITINSGLMYHVLAPAYAHLKWLTSWYWAIPYIAALYAIKDLPKKINRTHILFVAIAMIGLSFIGFMTLGRSAASYIIVNTLMLGACGVYDLFWWSILGEMLDLHKNPAKILGFGLSANVLGVLLGGISGSAIIAADAHGHFPTLLALTVVCFTLALLPPLHKHLSSLLTDHAYLTAFSGTTREQDSGIDRASVFEGLSRRENEVATRLLQGKTYRVIANELYISENTVKYFVKNIYSKLNIQSRTELIDIVLNKEDRST